MVKQRPSNTDLALHVAAELARAGVRDLCLCAGARNSPLVVLLSRIPEFRVFNFFEERSAAFFALGRIKSLKRPVAIVTTSGTAAAELLPPAIEAHYTGLPLLLVTADRPRNYRGTGAPQAIEQKGIFGSYAEVALDLAGEERDGLSNWSRRAPAHLNVCFEEPLLDREATQAELALPLETPSIKNLANESSRVALEKFLETSSLPLVIVSGLEEGARESVKQFLRALGAPVFLEGTSGLRECRELDGLRLLSTDRILGKLPKMKNPVDAVLRIGGVPTLRFWRDLEEKRSDLPVFSVSDVPFSGLSSGRTAPSELAVGDLPTLFSETRPRRVDHETFADLMEWDRALQSGIAKLLEAEPASEPGMIHALSRRIAASDDTRVYLGNSLPIREWDLAAARECGGWEIGANRGANGIDGQISTFYGFAREGWANWALIGDLTAMYDLSAPWVLSQLPALDARLVIMNNGGGKIFSRMFKSPAFQNQHRVGFESWAAMWGLLYDCWDRIPDAIEDVGPRVIELKPDPDATARFWVAYDELCR